MTDCGKLTEEQRSVLFSVPDDHDVSLEELEASRDAAEAHDVIVTPTTDPLDQDVRISASERELEKTVKQEIKRARAAGTPPARSGETDEPTETDQPDEQNSREPCYTVVTGTPAQAVTETAEQEGTPT